MKKYFITSDVHSFYNELLAALDEKGFDQENPEHILCICGDAFDRGDETLKVYEFLKKMHSLDRLVYVKGNHESLLKECYKQIYAGERPDYHHYSNGTVKTICQFCQQSEWILYDPTWAQKICDTIEPVLKFIDDVAVPYYEIGDYVLCHGWIPVNTEDMPYWYRKGRTYSYDPDWKNGNWERSAWFNGMECWHEGIKIPGKTVICGHWHSSWGHAHLHQDRKEWPQVNKPDWKKSFEPFLDNGIAAIDSCCAHSGFLNVIVIENSKLEV